MNHSIICWSVVFGVGGIFSTHPLKRSSREDDITTIKAYLDYKSISRMDFTCTPEIWVNLNLHSSQDDSSLYTLNMIHIHAHFQSLVSLDEYYYAFYVIQQQLACKIFRI